MVSLVPYQVVKDLGRIIQDICPTTTIIKYGDGVAQAPVRVIKLQLTFSEEVVVMRTFCVVKNACTPLILGMDFLRYANCRPDQAKE